MTKIQTDYPALELSELLDTRIEQPPAWVAYPGSQTFAVLLRPLGNRRQELLDAAQRIRWDTATMTRKVVVDQEQYLQIFADQIIVDWRGLTVATLRGLVLLDARSINNVKEDNEIACDASSKLLLLQHSPAFYGWANRVCADIALFNLEREAALKKK